MGFNCLEIKWCGPLVRWILKTASPPRSYRKKSSDFNTDPDSLSLSLSPTSVCVRGAVSHTKTFLQFSSVKTLELYQFLTPDTCNFSSKSKWVLG